MSGRLTVELSPELVTAVIGALDDRALGVLAERLAPRLASGASSQNGDAWLNARQAAAHLGMSPNALHKLTAARTIPFEQDGPGCKLWFRRSELDRWREEGGVQTRRRRAA